MTGLIDTQDGFTVCQGYQGKVTYLCAHADCEDVAWGCFNIYEMVRHLKKHEKGLWKKRTRNDK